jgi:hypothetical protein
VTVGPAVLQSSDEVKVCTKGLSSGGLVAVLEAHLGTALVRARESEELASGTVSFSGPVSELLSTWGFARTTATAPRSATALGGVPARLRPRSRRSRFLVTDSRPEEAVFASLRTSSYGERLADGRGHSTSPAQYPALAFRLYEEGPAVNQRSALLRSGPARTLAVASGAHLSIASSAGGPGVMGGRLRGRNSKRAVRRPDEEWRLPEGERRAGCWRACARSPRSAFWRCRSGRPWRRAVCRAGAWCAGSARCRRDA